MRSIFLLVALAAFGQSPDEVVKRITSDTKFKAATAFLDADYDLFVRELIELTEIPAPPFKEKVRAQAYLEKLRRLGLSDVEMDAEGNVMGVRKGQENGPLLAVLAHLDTVFPEGTNVKVKRSGTRLEAPGVGDDTRALALMLEVIRTLDAAKFTTASDILFVGNVGEEGEGDLRGVKYLLTKGKYKGRVKNFISIDGGEPASITNGGTGSKRFRVVFTGPGGHSYGAFGLVNPAYAMANAIAKFAKLKVPTEPKTTYNIGVVSGGTSVNSIPFEVSMDVDMRSESKEELSKLVDSFHGLLFAAVEEENAARSTAQGKIKMEAKLIGDRPAGETPRNSPLVETIAAVVRAFGLKPSYSISSTDSNIPISLGIPAATIGRGKGGRQHSLDEWVDVEKTAQVQAAHVALTTVLGLAGVR
ncbi:MAG: M20/M25/M40 family metallo-hydrolase [Bryobacteraceae bacterium]|nr:M20/M25/M40 family metallo-hydrolase [Bryobacteraceae bacterium]